MLGTVGGVALSATVPCDSASFWCANADLQTLGAGTTKPTWREHRLAVKKDLQGALSEAVAIRDTYESCSKPPFSSLRPLSNLPLFDLSWFLVQVPESLPLPSSFIYPLCLISCSCLPVLCPQELELELHFPTLLQRFLQHSRLQASGLD